MEIETRKVRETFKHGEKIDRRRYITKFLEFQAYVSINQPDIIVLNETWLKHTITAAEIFPNNDYKIFRLDRTADSHPPDHNIRNKFKQNGGGILIAVNNCLEMKPKSLKSSSKAEILSILSQLKNNKKICVTTCYRVGTLDLGVIITPKITWDFHQNSIISKASPQLRLLKRTCHFIKNQSLKRALYITLVRSLFEHCGEIWGPNAVVAQNQFAPIQKRAVKWILSESNRRYNEAEYINKLKALNLLPIQHYFHSRN